MMRRDKVNEMFTATVFAVAVLGGVLGFLESHFEQTYFPTHDIVAPPNGSYLMPIEQGIRTFFGATLGVGAYLGTRTAFRILAIRG